MMKETSITLQMPDAKLSPNARTHWAVKAKCVKLHRHIAKIQTPASLAGEEITDYQLHFTFSDSRRRDLDNFTARCKSYLDGISDATEQDDSTWGMKAPTREIKKGTSTVTITLHH